MVKKLIKGGSSITRGGMAVQSNNVSMFMLVIVILLSWVIYLLYDTYKSNKLADSGSQRINIINNVNRKVNDLYLPPLKSDNFHYHNRLNGTCGMGGIGGYNDSTVQDCIPVNIRTRGHIAEYTQIGILTKDVADNSPLILPLMGRRVDRNKMQYYAISNTGSMNTKLPVKSKGRSCTDERGCEEVYDGDSIFVEGYKASFNATIYENSNEFVYMV